MGVALLVLVGATVEEAGALDAGALLEVGAGAEGDGMTDEVSAPAHLPKRGLQPVPQ